jgi:soluble lytic murein transglycosylase-like protein
MIDLPPCADYYASYYQVPIAIIRAVAEQESGGDPLALNRNRDGSFDVGVMQINSRWIDPANPNGLVKYGIDLGRLSGNECQNIAVGTWILHQNYHALGDWGRAIAAYNRGQAGWIKGASYAWQVYSRIEDSGSKRIGGNR